MSFVLHLGDLSACQTCDIKQRLLWLLSFICLFIEEENGMVNNGGMIHGKRTGCGECLVGGRRFALGTYGCGFESLRLFWQM